MPAGKVDVMAKETVNRRKRTVLVVEDNKLNREILAELLADEYDVLQAENGLRGLEELNRCCDDTALVILDAYMPECNGFEFLERKRKDPRFDAIPVIMITASDTVDDEIRGLALGASDFITKPYNIEVMKNRMKSLIRLRESSTMLGRLETDSLTGLYSKEYFYHAVEEVLAADPNADYDVVCSDIESFRALNDRYGTAQCDSFLRAVADDLTERIPGLLSCCATATKAGPASSRRRASRRATAASSSSTASTPTSTTRSPPPRSATARRWR